MPCLTDKEIQHTLSEKRTLVIHNERVYDITKFVGTHPGGEKILKFYHGKHVTDVMENGVHSHSKNAYRWLEQYYIADYLKDDSSENKIKNGILNGTAQNSAYSSKAADTMYERSVDSDLVDWSKPVLWQVGHMGAKYHDWVDDPVDRPLRLFKSDFCEFFSSTPWYVIPIVWLPIVAMFAYRSYDIFHTSGIPFPSFVSVQVPVSLLPLFFVIGMLSWTFMEYALHRWLFHRDPPTTSYFLITLHFLLHGQHHKVPFDSGRLVFPPVPASVLGLFVYVFLRMLFVTAIADILVSGLIFGYVCYDLTHYYLHHGSPKRGGYFDRLRSYHVRHHFESPQLGFGISSKLWDYPFNTLIKPSKKAH